MNRSRRPRAFTLMETLVALGLLLVLVGAVFAFGMNLTVSRDRLNEHMQRAQALRVFLDRLEQDLHTSLALDAGQGAGIVGDDSSIRLLSRSVGAIGQTQALPVALRDLTTSEYRWNASGHMLEASRGSAGGDPSWNTIARDLGFVQWRYHDGSAWVTSFDSGSAQRLPVAVEVAIWFTDPRSPEEQLAPPQPPEADESADTAAGGSIFDTFAPPQPGAEEEPSDPAEQLDDSRRDWPPPDRVRVIIIPDAPEFEYGRSYDDNADVPLTPPPDGSGGSQ